MSAIRRGPWLFAVHRCFTWKPWLDRPTEGERALGIEGFSLWWLWFEVARMTVKP
jgi:hypothetical protein